LTFLFFLFVRIVFSDLGPDALRLPGFGATNSPWRPHRTTPWRFPSFRVCAGSPPSSAIEHLRSSPDRSVLGEGAGDPRPPGHLGHGPGGAPSSLEPLTPPPDTYRPLVKLSFYLFLCWGNPTPDYFLLPGPRIPWGQGPPPGSALAIPCFLLLDLRG